MPTATLTLKACSIILAAMLAGRAFVASAAEVTGNGFSARDVTTTETKELGDGRRLMHLRSSGLFYTDDPDSALNKTTYWCFGTHLLDAGGDSDGGRGYCAGVGAKHGDMWWLDWRGDLESGTWQFTGGTGIFEGIKGGGTWRNMRTISPEAETLTTWSGSWELAD